MIIDINSWALRDVGFFVDGQHSSPTDRPRGIRNSPAHDVAVSRVVHGTSADVDHAVQVARHAFEDGRWSGISGAERAAVLLRAAQGIRERAEELALIETLETGKPINQSRGEVEGSAGIYEYAAGIARALHGDSFNNLGDDLFGLVTREPVGVVGLITPWNFPFLILAERVPFILASGCTCVCKPSELTSATTVMMAEILSEAGLPNGVFNVVTGLGPDVGNALTHHPDIDMVSFTGSTAVGRKALAASVDNLKRVGLELGGKNPHIVFADADLDDAADGVVFATVFNAGQCCVGGSRLLVEASVAEDFFEKLRVRYAAVRVGDPLDENTQVGASVTKDHHQKILDYIQAGKDAGATCICGGGELETSAGQFVQPTLFTQVTEDMTINRDEIFGPVMSVMTFEGIDEAVRLANDTVFGLSASIWSKNIDTATMAMRRVRAGRVWINTTLAGGPELPLGGMKQSGHGREAGIYGVEEYTDIKSVHIALGKREPWVQL